MRQARQQLIDSLCGVLPKPAGRVGGRRAQPLKAINPKSPLRVARSWDSRYRTRCLSVAPTCAYSRASANRSSDRRSSDDANSERTSFFPAFEQLTGRQRFARLTRLVQHNRYEITEDCCSLQLVTCSKCRAGGFTSNHCVVVMMIARINDIPFRTVVATAPRWRRTNLDARYRTVSGPRLPAHAIGIGANHR